MLLFKAAKLAGGLRLLIATTAPLVVSSAALLSARSVAYLVGFSLGGIGVTLWPIIATLIVISGIFATTTPQCDAYHAELRRIQLANEAAAIAAIPLIEAWKIQYKAWQVARDNFNRTPPSCIKYRTQNTGPCGSIACFGPPITFCVEWASYPVPAPAYPTISYITYSPGGCSGSSAPNCPSSKKVWLQTIWASQSEFATQTKSCFLIGYSYTILDGLKIEYNPFELNKTFLESRAMNPFVVAGNRFRNLNDSEWKNLESTIGWDKGYWVAEQTDVECRGWNPGWSRKIK